MEPTLQLPSAQRRFSAPFRGYGHAPNHRVHERLGLHIGSKGGAGGTWIGEQGPCEKTRLRDLCKTRSLRA